MSSHAQPAPLPHSPRRPPRASTASSSRRPLPAPAPTPGPRQRALCIGIRDIRTLDYQDEEEEWSPLPHAHDDVDRIVGMLQRHHGYQSDEIHIMKDAPGIRRRLQPTRLNILRQVDKFAKDVRPGDRLFFYYAGHSTQLQCTHGTESDDQDEVMCAVDGYILDNVLRSRLVDKLPAGCQLRVILDTCHSGTMFDLPRRGPRDIFRLRLVARFGISAPAMVILAAIIMRARLRLPYWKRRIEHTRERKPARQPPQPLRQRCGYTPKPEVLADIVVISGAPDSDEAFETGKGGDLTNWILGALDPQPRMTFRELFKRIQQGCVHDYEKRKGRVEEWNIRFPFGHENHGMWLNKLQRPQLSISQTLNLDDEVLL